MTVYPRAVKICDLVLVFRKGMYAGEIALRLVLLRRRVAQVINTLDWVPKIYVTNKKLQLKVAARNGT